MLQSNESLLAVMDYKQNKISFEEINGKMMINATQMAKPFGKRPIDWLNTQQAKDLVKTILKVRKITLAEIQVVRRGGQNPGTWFDQELALLFAQWLSPEFYLACNQKILELVHQKALQVPARHGVPGTVIKGLVMYAYATAMKVFGNPNTGAWRRKQKHPDHFKKEFGRNFVTAQYLDAMKSYYDWKNSTNQLKLSL